MIPQGWRSKEGTDFTAAHDRHLTRSYMGAERTQPLPSYEEAAKAAKVDLLDLFEHETGPKPVHIPGRIGWANNG